MSGCQSKVKYFNMQLHVVDSPIIRNYFFFFKTRTLTLNPAYSFGKSSLVSFFVVWRFLRLL